MPPRHLALGAVVLCSVVWSARAMGRLRQHADCQGDQMIVVFDTNVWKSALYLRSPAAAAVALYLSIQEAKVGLPEVVRLEVQHHLRNDIIKYRDDIRRRYDSLLVIFGKMREVALPTDEQVDELVSSFFHQSGFNFLEVPFSPEAARDSFIRTIDGRRPSHKSQQFKDGILLVNCKELAERDDVVLVTEDKAFYDGDDTSQGITKELAEEVAGCKYSLRLLSSLRR